MLAAHPMDVVRELRQCAWSPHSRPFSLATTILSSEGEAPGVRIPTKSFTISQEAVGNNVYAGFRLFRSLSI